MFRRIRVWRKLRRASSIDPRNGMRTWPGWESGTWNNYLRRQMYRNRAGLPLLGEEPPEPVRASPLLPIYVSTESESGSWFLQGDLGDKPTSTIPVVKAEPGEPDGEPDDDSDDGELWSDEEEGWDHVAEIPPASTAPVPYVSRHSVPDDDFEAIITGLDHLAEDCGTVPLSAAVREQVLGKVYRHWVAKDETGPIDQEALASLLANSP